MNHNLPHRCMNVCRTCTHRKQLRSYQYDKSSKYHGIRFGCAKEFMDNPTSSVEKWEKKLVPDECPFVLETVVYQQ